jgi:hypothetical protein
MRIIQTGKLDSVTLYVDDLDRIVQNTTCPVPVTSELEGGAVVGQCMRLWRGGDWLHADLGFSEADVMARIDNGQRVHAELSASPLQLRKIVLLGPTLPPTGAQPCP